ncbi:MAG: YiiX/YebB-like N1pC/P60 family cysteine hydrolase [Porphyromonas sp.]|nr:YiiX/YebB-like N1pC/P60 family cysteine hydrolase [Porphyromonas sp.]
MTNGSSITRSKSARRTDQQQSFHLSATVCFAVFLLCLLSSSCKESALDGRRLSLPDSLWLRNGDLIFRMGEAWFSHYFRDIASDEKQYSHVGLIEIDYNGKTLVYHCEDYAAAGHQGVCVEPIDSFMMTSSAVGIYRFHNLSEGDCGRIVQRAKNYLRQRVPFDYKFDSESDEQLYCTEFVVNCLREAPVIGQIGQRLSFFGRKVYGLDDLYRLPFCTPVWLSASKK